MALGERGRNPFKPRSTAEAACALRAAGTFEKDPAVRCPDHMAAGLLGGFNATTFAKSRIIRRGFLWGARRQAPGSYTYEIARTKFIDEVTLSAAAEGLDELIILGAGLDSRPYRMAAQLEGTRVLEVDHPASQSSKRKRLRRRSLPTPSNVTYVPFDLNRDDLDAVLGIAGHERSARTLIIWSGVSPYLAEESVANVLSWVGEHRDPPASIVFDVVWAEVIDGSREYPYAAAVRRQVASTGEPFRWGVPEGRVEESLAPYGLRAERVLGPGEIRSTYLKRSDGTLHEPPFDFGALMLARAA
jgi:methyltransferase (TIGR00027 family)